MSAKIKRVLTFTLIALVVVSFSAVASAKKKAGPYVVQRHSDQSGLD